MNEGQGVKGNFASNDAVPLTHWEQALQLAQDGGPVVLILCFLSILALAVALLKLYQFFVAGVRARRKARKAVSLYRAGRGEEALALANGARGIAASVVAQVLRGKLGTTLPVATVREEAMRSAGDQIESLRGQLRLLEVIATLAPLLGLFGTVLGMIEAFQQLEAAGSQVNPSVLSGGIWEALLTTAVGLAVAIPTVAVLNYFESLIERLAHDLESMISQLFTEDLTEAFFASGHALTDRADLESHAGSRLEPALSSAGG